MWRPSSCTQGRARGALLLRSVVTAAGSSGGGGEVVTVEAKAKVAKKEYTPLIKVTWRPEQEFKTLRRRHTSQILWRLVQVGWKEVVVPTSMFMLAASGATVLTLSGYEALIALRPGMSCIVFHGTA